MNTKEFKDLMIESNKKLADLKERAKNATGDELVSILEERDQLVEKTTAARSEMAMTMNGAQIDMSGMTNKAEERGKALKNGETISIDARSLLSRANTTAGSTFKTTDDDFLIPAHTDTVLHDAPFATMSRLYAGLNFLNLPNGESFEMPFTTDYDEEGGTTAEGGNYTDIDSGFDSIKLGKVKITAYFEVTEELAKLPAVDYYAKIKQQAVEAVQRKIVDCVINGTTDGEFKGILNSNSAKVIPTSSDLGVSALDVDFVRKVQDGFGFSEEIEGSGALVINKATLTALDLLKGNKSAEHAFDINTAAHTINEHGTAVGTPYIISSKVKAFASATAGTDYVGFYGNPANYTVALFSNIEIAESREYKFKQGIIAYRVSVMCGGAPNAYCGFERIKKVAA